jgi:hypothetical protein
MAHMGHASPRAALIYQHATRRGERAIGDFLGGLIERRHDGQAAAEGPTDVDGARGGACGTMTRNATNPAQIAIVTADLGGSCGADDGTRTRDPHLGKAAAAVHDVTIVPVTCGLIQLVVR